MLQLMVLCAALAVGFYYLNDRRQRQTPDVPTIVPFVATATAPPVGRVAPRQWPQLRLPRLRVQDALAWLRWQGWSIAAGRLPRLLAAGLLLLAIVLMGRGQLGIDGKALPAGALAAYAAGLALFAGLDELARRQPGIGVPGVGDHVEPLAETLAPKFRRIQFWLLSGAGVVMLLVWQEVRGRPADASYRDLLVLWIVAMLAALAGVADWPRRGWPRWLQAARSYLASAQRVDLVLIAAVTLVALLARGLALDRFPYIFGGDEGSQSMNALAVLHGAAPNFFGTGWNAVPILYFAIQGLSIQLFGDSVSGVRMASAVLGTAAVPCTYLLVRRFFGRTTAFIAAIILAVFHYHLFSSRIATINVGDSLLTAPALLLLDVALTNGRRLPALAAGMLAGLGQYFYFGGRIVILVLLLYAALALIAGEHGVRLAAFSWRRARTVGQTVLWMVLGGMLLYAPLLAYYTVHPTEFTRRIDAVSMFSSGWLTAEMKRTGQSAIYLVLQQLERAIFLPFHTAPSPIYYGSTVPLLGVPMAVLTAAGLTLACVRLWRRSYFGLVVAWWGAFIALGLTEDPTQTQRLFSTAPFMAIFSAFALVTLAQIALKLARAPRRAVYGGLGVLVALLIAWNLNYYYFAPDHEARYYGRDPNSLIATDLAYNLRALGHPETVYLLGAPRMFYDGFLSLPFIAPNAKGVDVREPYTPATPKPALAGPSMFVVLPHRAAELPIIQGWFPNGQLQQVKDTDGAILYTTWMVG